MKLIIGLCIVILFAVCQPAMAQWHIQDGSSIITVQKQNPADVGVQVQGITENGYLKYVTALSVNYKGQIARLSSQISYVLTPTTKNEVMERSQDGTSLIAGITLDVRGEVSHEDTKGNTKSTEIIGILYNDKRDIIGSWLIAKKSDLPSSKLSKIRKQLKKPIQTGDKNTKAQLDSPIWLFRVNPDYSLSLEP